MEKIVTAASVTAWVGLLVAGAVFAAQTSTVTATVTAQNLSVSVTDGAVAYGALAASASQDTTASGLNDTQAAMNFGNTTETFNIQGQNTTVGSPTWTLATTIGANQYTHQVSTNSGSFWDSLSTSYSTLVLSKAISGTQTFDLKITVPSSTTNFNQQDPNVTVQAVAG